MNCEPGDRDGVQESQKDGCWGTFRYFHHDHPHTLRRSHHDYHSDHPDHQDHCLQLQSKQHHHDRHRYCHDCHHHQPYSSRSLCEDLSYAERQTDTKEKNFN